MAHRWIDASDIKGKRNYLVPPGIVGMMTGTIYATQKAPGRPVALHYTDGSIEEGSYVGDIRNAENYFSVVSTIQEQRA